MVPAWPIAAANRQSDGGYTAGTYSLLGSGHVPADNRVEALIETLGGDMRDTAILDKPALHAELERVRADFHALLDAADPDDLARPTNGTRWTNEQLLFHMLFGYLIVRTLLILMRIGSRLPRPVGRGFARPLDAAARPFNSINYWGSCIGARIVDHRRMGRRLDAVIASLHRRLDREDGSTLQRSMPYPARWDPYFADVMARADLYRYGTQHYDHHRRQLTLAATSTDAPVQ